MPFDQGFRYTGFIRYISNISVIKITGQKANMFSTTFLFILSAKKNSTNHF